MDDNNTDNEDTTEIIQPGPLLAGIYRIRNANGDCYIGSSIDIKGRWRQHRSRLNKDAHTKNDSHLQKAWRKYGEESFIFEIIEQRNVVGMTKRQARRMLRDLEQSWMDKENPHYNKAPAAESNLGFKHTPETRERMSAAQKGSIKWPNGRVITDEWRAKISETSKNRPPPSEETRAKISAASKGRIQSPEERAR